VLLPALAEFIDDPAGLGHPESCGAGGDHGQRAVGILDPARRLDSALGAGRKRKEDDIDPAVGIELGCKVGTSVREGERIARIFAADEDGAIQAERSLLRALSFSGEEVQEPELALDFISAEEPAQRAAAVTSRG
jgi:hypothetical protein